MDKIGIVILNWNQPKLTIDTITSLQKISKDNFSIHIYLVDNNSKDDSLELFQKEYTKDQKITITNSGENLGYSGGNNFGIKLAIKDKCNYVLVINNDLIFDKNFLNKLYSKIKEKNDLAIVGPKIYFAPGYEFHKDRYTKSEIGHIIWSIGGRIDWNNILGSNIGVDEFDRGQYDNKKIKSDFISGCCFIVSSKLFKDVGYFDEKYFMYFEDVDLCHRAVKNGYHLVIEPKSYIWHVNSGSSSSGSNLHDYYITRNRLLFGFRYAGIRTKFALFRESIKFLFSSNLFKKRAVLDYYQNNLYKGNYSNA